MKTFNVTINVDDGRVFHVKNVKAKDSEHAKIRVWYVEEKNGGVPRGWSRVNETSLSEVPMVTYSIEEVA